MQQIRSIPNRGPWIGTARGDRCLPKASASGDCWIPVVNVDSSNHRNGPTRLRQLGSRGLLWRVLLVLFFLASFGFRSVEPCPAGHHDADIERAGAHHKIDHKAPSGGHRRSEHDDSCCCASASTCVTRGEASPTNAASSVQESIRIAVLVAGPAFRSPPIPDNSWISQERYHAPPAMPLFITLKALLI